MRPSLFALTNDHSVSRTMINAFDANDFNALGTIGSLQRTSVAARSAPMAVEQQLQLMNTINTMVKNSQFTNQLANSIFTLCFQLKNSGFMLEQSHKNELNKVFISLRQACCRDNGQLGTPCRYVLLHGNINGALTKVANSYDRIIPEYLRVRAKPSAEEREKRKERRKSMPLQSSHQEPSLKSSHSFHGSTPNLAEAGVDLKLQSLSSCHTGNRSVARYDRAALMGLRTDASLPYGLNVRQAVATIAPEILR
uniref:Uncharacterized protein n=1 Tax=Heterorhabditis bacteriophora TaxID=37862 RepID=A0A1I7XEY4_HETBA